MNERRVRVEQLFNDMVQSIREMPEEFDKALTEYTSNPVKPAMDVMEEEENIIVKTDLPGVNREDIKIDLTEDTLTIQAQFEEEVEEEGEEEGEEGGVVKFHRKERRYGSASRTMVLPAKVKMDEVNAKFDNGVLTITMPKLEKKEVFEVKVD